MTPTPPAPPRRLAMGLQVELLFGGELATFGMLLILFGALFWAGGNSSGTVQYGNEWRLWRSDRVALGRVTRIDERPHDHRGWRGTTLRFDYTFSTPEGRSRVGHSFAGFDAMTRMFGRQRADYPVEGGPAEVVYLTDHPEISKLTGTWLQVQSPLLLVGVLIGTEFLGMALVAVGARRGLRRLRQLSVADKVLPGVRLETGGLELPVRVGSDGRLHAASYRVIRTAALLLLSLVGVAASVLVVV